MSSGAVIVGSWSSITERVNEQETLLPAPSSAMRVTMTLSGAITTVPAGGSWRTDGFGASHENRALPV